MTDDQVRHLRLASWHAAESIARESTGNLDLADYHLQAALEDLRLADRRAAGSVQTAYDVAGVCAELKDAAGILSW